jgi:purine-nucleoside/S-methyl-5'-thioadenosine phosphorylase / adenosine deaminase
VTSTGATVRFNTPRGRVHVRFTTRADGDLNADVVPAPVLAARWRAVAARPVVWLEEEHGTTVVVVDGDGHHRAPRGDALVTADVDRALGIWVGDCAPVALVADEGVVAAVHAGWRGLAAGVLGETAAAMRALGATRIDAVVGPCIHAECYEFGPADLFALASRFGASVTATTSWGTPALDLPAAVRAALAAEDVSVIDVSTPCTACDDRYWSHRARGDRERHGMAVWLEANAA